MKLVARSLVPLLFVLPALPAAAETLDVGIGDDTVRLGLAGPIPGIDARAQYDVGGIYRSESGDDVFSPHVGFLVTGDTGARPATVTAGLGLRAAYVNGEHDDGAVLALGGQVDVRFPGYERIALGAHAYGAPEVTSFGDLESYYDVGLSLGYEVIKGASVSVGWRELRADVDPDGKIKADDGLYGGLRLTF